MDKLEKGRLGEDAVCRLLLQRGHEIIARNYHRRCGEIDIISKCGGFVVFTEVKARKRGSLVSGLEAVDFRKQAKIVRTADLWLSDNDTGLQPRYDIAEVTLTGEPPRVVSVEIYEDAFSADGIYTVN
ncbi:MAG: YraN family protein [Oscillospiraceae bacterium]|nr:YraN family protein [Oscillospiraceae bacterium]